MFLVLQVSNLELAPLQKFWPI